MTNRTHRRNTRKSPLAHARALTVMDASRTAPRGRHAARCGLAIALLAAVAATVVLSMPTVCTSTLLLPLACVVGASLVRLVEWMLDGLF
jgi:hypothetical protein